MMNPDARCGTPVEGLEAPGRSAVLLTSYGSGSPEGKGLGKAGYSYDFVARAFAPLLNQWGDVVDVPRPETQFRRPTAETLRGHAGGVHVCFRALQHVEFAPAIANVVVPAWEFPEVPDHAFDGDPRNNWVAMANASDLVIVGGPFTARAFQQAGIVRPIHVVPVPVNGGYFAVPPWDARATVRLDCPAYVLEGTGGPVTCSTEPPVAGEPPRSWKQRLWGHYRRYVKPYVPEKARNAVMAAYRELHSPKVNYPKTLGVDLSGVVYTSIFSPVDGRKNWHDMVTGFLQALGDRADVTLVLKLIASDPRGVRDVLAHYNRLQLPHRCRIVIISDFISQQQMLNLVRASAYYLTTTRAEGNCLPLMDYLAAARPGISGCHTAISDYFSEDLGLVLESHPEPAAWPQDSRFRCRATWHRLVYPSLIEQLQRSYRAAVDGGREYRAWSAAARAKMQSWASAEAVWPRLKAALDEAAATADCPSVLTPAA